jgi:hypothetical protein
MVIAASVRVCSAITHRGIHDRGKVWHRETMCGLCIPLSKHVGRSLLRHPKISSRTLDGGSAVEVVHQLG